MNIFSYKLSHDYGLAPNPFWGVMSLAVCKGKIRKNKNLTIGDWVVGTTSATLGQEGHLIFAMRVDDVISFDQYWTDPRFECKKPVVNGSLIQMYGDNFYHTSEDGTVVQEYSAHSAPGGVINSDHCKRDARGRNVLLSKHFYYFGDSAPRIPDYLSKILCKTRDFHYKDIHDEVKKEFLKWLISNFTSGINGDPINWREYNLPKIDYFSDEEE